MAVRENPRVLRLLTTIDRTLTQTAGSPRAKIIHGALTVAAVAFLTAKLWHLGFAAIVQALPHQPLYYAFFALSYAALPLSEMTIYRGLTQQPLPVSVFLRKRVYNEAVLDYSGEGYLFLRLRAALSIDPRQLASDIKDVNLLSGVVSNGATVCLLIMMVATGRQGLLAGPGHDFPAAMIAAGSLVSILLIGMAVFHRRLIGATAAKARFIILVHTARLGASLLLQVAQWHAVLPDVPLSRWGLFLAVWLLVTRVPFLPNRDLVLAGVGLTLTRLINAPQAAVAGMLVAGAVLPLLGHGIVLVLTGAKPQNST